MKKQEPTYYGILPAEVRYCKLLSPMEKIMYCEISALASSTGKCWASNDYFAELYDVEPTTVSAWINGLLKYNFISVTGAKAKNRKISLTNILRKKIKKPSEKPEGQPSEKAEHNNTSIIIQDNIPEVKPQTIDFNDLEYLDNIMAQSKQSQRHRYFSAYFLRRKGLRFNSVEAVEGAMKRHYRAGKELANFSSEPEKLKKAFDDAENLVVQGQHVNWGLETVLKLIVK